METDPRHMQFLKKIPHSGIVCTLVGSILIAGNSIMTAIVITTDNLYYINLLSCVPCIPVTLLLMIVRRNNPLGVSGERLLIIAFSIFQALAQLLSNYSYAYISVTDANTVFSTSTIMVVFLAPIILKEQFKIIYLWAAILSGGGVLLIERPSFLFPSSGNGAGSNQTIGVLLALSSAVSVSFAFLCNRRLLKTDVWVFQFSSIVVFAVGNIVAMIASGESFTLQSPREYAIAISSGLPFILGAIFFSFAFQLENAGPVSIVGMIIVPLTLIFQVVFQNTIPLSTTYYGCVLVLAGTFFTFFQQWERGKNKVKEISDRIYQKATCVLHIPYLNTVSYNVRKKQEEVDKSTAFGNDTLPSVTKLAQ